MRPFTFAAALQGIYDGAELADIARRAEGHGYHALAVPDHLIPQLCPVPAMTAIAAATRTPADQRRIVFNNDLRHPAVLAQDLASHRRPERRRLEVAIGGRLEPPRVRRDRPALRPGAGPLGPAGGGGHRAQGLLRATGRSASPASTTRSPTTTPSPSPSSARIRRS